MLGIVHLGVPLWPDPVHECVPLLLGLELRLLVQFEEEFKFGEKVVEVMEIIIRPIECSFHLKIEYNVTIV